MQNKIIAEDFNLKKEDKKNFKKSIIERSNITNEFTLEDVEHHQADLNKMERELTSQLSLSESVVKNVEANHAFISKMSDEQLSVAHYLFETKSIIKKGKAQLKEVKATKKKYKEVMDTVMAKFGFVESNVVTDEPAK